MEKLYSSFSDVLTKTSEVSRPVNKKINRDYNKVFEVQMTVLNIVELKLIDIDDDILFHYKTETVPKVMGTGSQFKRLFGDVRMITRWSGRLH